MRQLIAGNWKMNGLSSSLGEIDRMVAGLGAARCDAAVCVPATLLSRAAERAAGSPLAIGAQDCHWSPSGAHTGDISAEMIADAGGKVVIVGHSERRIDHGETDAQVRAKAEAALAAGLSVIVCIGETEADQKAGETLAVLDRQVAGSIPAAPAPDRLAIAYEPVWAIGTGLTPSTDDIRAAHAHIRQRVAERLGPAAAAIRLLYGGSVKPGNAREILAVQDVDGGLIGGASLKAADLLAIVAAAR